MSEREQVKKWLDAVRERHLTDLQGKTFYEGHVLVDLAALIEHIEHECFEVEAIVSWLRSHPPIRYGEPDPFSTREIAHRIETGAYRTEEKP